MLSRPSRHLTRSGVMLGRAFLAAVLALPLTTCATNPVTGQRQLTLVSESQEIEMGKSGAADVAKSIGLYSDPSVQTYVSNIGLKMATASERPNLPWSFQVVDDPAVNAFALPGGFIFVTRGLLTHITSEAELATVVGHEIGHVTARHSVQQITRSQVAQLGLGVGMILSPAVRKFGGVASQGLGLLFLKYSRDNEDQADALGFRYASRQGYDVRQMIDMFTMLQNLSAPSGSQLPQFLATHPDPGNRLKRTQERLDSAKIDFSQATVNRDSYLKLLDGMVYGDNPRQGYFQGSTFLHPDLEFQIDFPQGWKFQNGTDAVVGASPNGDAVIQLGLASVGSPSEAAQQFAGQEGVTATQPTRADVNGNPAYALSFTAQSDQTPIKGLATFLSFGGNTYQLLAYTATASYAGYDAAFRNSLGSFRRLTDPAVLGVKPMRVQLVKLPKAMTLAAFDQQYPSAVPNEEIALINQVEPTASLAQGMLVKRVVKQ